jgi:hypothetical protein
METDSFGSRCAGKGSEFLAHPWMAVGRGSQHPPTLGSLLELNQPLIDDQRGRSSFSSLNEELKLPTTLRREKENRAGSRVNHPR